MTVEVNNVPGANRDEARVDGEARVAGVAECIRTAKVVAFVHTEVAPECAGRGVGSALVRSGLDETRASGLLVLATCPFFAGWIARHPEYQDLLSQSRGARFERPRLNLHALSA
ncbi:GNAT family N-acetyltransferase [Streptomyces gibsoniae]|uniref:GNAT family N-acetyltransferase n=1 Tax=Streptomyces gibsoniae TaxID=3075529 RepID=A0ABU2U971_9ACTN|nr:GNAT family N-acetyltransferase [Streptomyces sp. DSM 41699]MDT0469576.1 GNAT family N-acetyltransferase [Streptomyces sp. DSM 41699]